MDYEPSNRKQPQAYSLLATPYSLLFHSTVTANRIVR
jgi:hypothetical protein